MKIQLRSKLALSALLSAAIGSDYYYSDKSLSPISQANVIEFVTRAPASSNVGDPARPKKGAKPAKPVSDDSSSASGDDSVASSDEAAVSSDKASIDVSTTEAQTLAQQLCETHTCSDDDVKAFGEALGKDKGLMVFARMLVSKQGPTKSVSSDESLADTEEVDCSKQSYAKDLTPSEKKLEIMKCEEREATAKAEIEAKEKKRKEEADKKAEETRLAELDKAFNADIEAADKFCKGDLECGAKRLSRVLAKYKNKDKKVSDEAVQDAYDTLVGGKLDLALKNNPDLAAEVLENLSKDMPKEYAPVKGLAMDQVRENIKTSVTQANREQNPSLVQALLQNKVLYTTAIKDGLTASNDSLVLGLYETKFMPQIAALIGTIKVGDTTNTGGTGARTDLRGVPTSQAQVLPANQLQQLPLPQVGTVPNPSTIGAPIPNSGRSAPRGAYPQ